MTGERQTGLSDLELIDQLMAGRPDGFQQFYGRYKRLIYHCIRARARPGEADDLFQEFFLWLQRKQWRPLLRWQRARPLPSFLAVVVRNFTISRLRVRSADTQAAGGWDDLADLGGAQPGEQDDRLLQKGLLRATLRAWGQLREQDRTLMCWKLHRELSNEEMADRRGWTANTLKVRLSEARKRLIAAVRMEAPEYFPAGL